MSTIFVDSSVWIDFLRGQVSAQTTTLRDLLAARDPLTGSGPVVPIVVGDLVLLEVLRGIADDGQLARTRDALLSFPQVRLGGTEIALAATEHYRALRRLGITVRKAVDCLIAAWCIGRGATLLHSDRDFEPFARHRGLQIHGAAA
ncbi:MAG: PIN domain nuclease [Acetobacteraceae bacterium]|nr:PIN domain nuclease [Acetobacteraceae bacterium]